LVGVGHPFVDVRRHHPNFDPPIRLASDPKYKGSWTANAASVKPKAPIARTQRRPQISKTTDTGAQSMRYVEAAAKNNTTWLVIGR
jgi:hypothetical protein